MPEGRHRARPESPRRPRRERPSCVRSDRRAGQGCAQHLSTRSEVFEQQIRSAAGRSPFYEQLWRELADEPLVDALVTDYDWRTPLKLAGGLHCLVLAGQLEWDRWGEGLVEHADFLRHFVAERGVQTNEVQRSWVLLPCFLEVARRTGAETFDLIELGASAGFNLQWDRYRYRYAAGEWGPAGAELELAGEERGPVPEHLLALAPRVVSRIGIDLAPVDVTTDEGARLLRSFVWPHQTWRLDALDKAIASLRANRPELRRGDVADELPALLSESRRGELTVVFQTAVLGYLPEERRRRVREALAIAGQARPLALVESWRPRSGEHTFWALVVQIWPDGGREEVACADFHGAWVDWRAK